MTSGRTRLPVVAAVATVALAGIAARGGPSVSVSVCLVMPLLVPAFWTGVALTERRHGLARQASLAAVVLGLVAAGVSAGLVVAVHVLAGNVVGTLWRRRGQALLVVLAGALCLAPGFWIGLDGQSVPELFATWGEVLRENHAAGLPEDLPASERAAAVAAFEAGLAGTLEVQQRLWPSLVAFGLVVQAALILVAGRLLARLGGGEAPGPARLPFVTWRAPFATVWLLIGGLAASLSPVGRGLNDLGWNLVLASSVLLAIQGMAVLAWFGRRVLPPPVRGLFWIVGIGFFAPVLVGSGLLVALADQWWDLRRLRRPPNQDVEQA